MRYITAIRVYEEILFDYVDKIFSDHQMCWMVTNYERVRDHLCPDHWCLITEMVLGTAIFNKLTWLMPCVEAG
jgi:hypothetical protein